MAALQGGASGTYFNFASQSGGILITVIWETLLKDFGFIIAIYLIRAFVK